MGRIISQQRSHIKALTPIRKNVAMPGVFKAVAEAKLGHQVGPDPMWPIDVFIMRRDLGRLFAQQNMTTRQQELKFTKA